MVMSMSVERRGGGSVVHEEFIATVDVRQLHALRWPIMRALAPHFVEASELRHYLESTLSSGRWTCVRAVPSRRSEAAGHVFDVFGTSLT
jgi:hypothetical protein